MTEETTSEQLAEIEGQPTEFTPPEGWQLVPLGEVLNEIYIRPIEIEPEPQPQPQPADTADELRSEIHYLQRELAVAKEELTIAAAVSQQLQIELDAAQQVPADLPELRQLRLRLADMTLDRDQYKDAWNQIFTDQTTIRETTAADTVEAIIEWLEPFRGCNSPALALLLLEALPHIMRSLTGLEQD